MSHKLNDDTCKKTGRLEGETRDITQIEWIYDEDLDTYHGVQAELVNP